MNLLIENSINCHYEIIESIIVKCRHILNIKNDIPINIYLYIINNQIFKKYITNKYPKIIFKPIKNFNFYINCSIYDKHYEYLDKKKSNKKYISHEITERLINNPNVFFLTPLSKINYIYADILPFCDNKKKTNIPIYIIQGKLNENRRYLDLLIKILDNTYNYDYLIKLVGKGILPPKLNKFRNKIILKNNLNFYDYHNEFVDAYCILPLISKKTHPHYYSKKLTATINYTRAYNLKCLIDHDLQEIYNLKYVSVYTDINDIELSFKKTLEDYYS